MCTSCGLWYQLSNLPISSLTTAKILDELGVVIKSKPSYFNFFLIVFI